MTGASRGTKRPHQPFNEHADAWRQLPVAWIQQRDRRRRGRTVRQYSDQHPLFQIGLDMIARHLNQSQAKARRGDEALGAVDRNRRGQCHLAHAATDDELDKRARPGWPVKGFEFFAEAATDAETAMLDALGRRNIADSLAELLRLDAIRMKRLTITANAAE